ncbi:MAG: carbamoyltransferase [candidate division Zixibacteria bacterium]|nr:carbamoyltransferase [candidate division Zixibacteria bacterium]
MNILGISAFYHDSAACLVQDGRIVAAAQEERFSRLKHDSAFPGGAIAYCLAEAGLSPDQVDLVAFYDKPWTKFERLLETYLTFSPVGIRSFMKAMPVWLKEKLWLENRIRKALPGYRGKVIFSEHHQSHAASAFFPSPFDRAAILTIDGVGEWATASWGTGQGNRVDLAAEMRFPHSLGLLYSAFTYFAGFRVNSGEYKLMGLAPYGRPVYLDAILDKLIDLKEDGSFRLNMKYFNYCQGLTMTSRAFARLFGGPPRKPEGPITRREMDLAASIQTATEEIILRMGRHVRRETGESNLCLAGGVALNCVANGRILKEKIFDRLWIQPAAGDAGGALGAALYAWYQYLDNERCPSSDGRDAQRDTLLGPSWKTDDIMAWLQREGYPFRRHKEPELIDRVARALADKKVIGWFSGRMEFGPRALGARSILADPRTTDMLATLNLKIKFRESFRPLAPAVLAEDADRYFELDTPSPYMLLTAPVRAERRRRTVPFDDPDEGIERIYRDRSDIPAVTHLDYSARIQTVDRRDNPRFHALLARFKELTGCAVLINTSFNVRGEPIVCTPQEAYRCFMTTGMDMLVLEEVVLEKGDQPPQPDGRPLSGQPD